MTKELPRLVRIVDSLLHHQFYYLQAKAKEPEKRIELIDQQLLRYELFSERALYAQGAPITDTIAYFLGPYEQELFTEFEKQKQGLPLEPEVELFDGLLKRFSELDTKRHSGKLGSLERRVVPYWHCFEELPQMKIQLPHRLRRKKELYA